MVVCPANELLISRLLELKAEEPSDNKKALFDTAIKSIRKFPLPIATKADALDLVGVGHFIGSTIGAILEGKLIPKRQIISLSSESLAPKTHKKKLSLSQPQQNTKIASEIDCSLSQPISRPPKKSKTSMSEVSQAVAIPAQLTVPPISSVPAKQTSEDEISLLNASVLLTVLYEHGREMLRTDLLALTRALGFTSVANVGNEWPELSFLIGQGLITLHSKPEQCALSIEGQAMAENMVRVEGSFLSPPTSDLTTGTTRNSSVSLDLTSTPTYMPSARSSHLECEDVMEIPSPLKFIPGIVPRKTRILHDVDEEVEILLQPKTRDVLESLDSVSNKLYSTSSVNKSRSILTDGFYGASSSVSPNGHDRTFRDETWCSSSVISTPALSVLQSKSESIIDAGAKAALLRSMFPEQSPSVAATISSLKVARPKNPKQKQAKEAGNSEAIAQPPAKPRKQKSNDKIATKDCGVPVLVTPPTFVHDTNWSQWDIVCLIDDRESGPRSNREYICTELNKKRVLSERRSLPIGDVMWIARHKLHPNVEIVLDCIVERKKMSDLIASIKDDRYREQRSRLKRTGMSRIVYLIEGVLDHRAATYENAVNSSKANLNAVFGFLAHQVLNTYAAVDFLCTLHRLVAEGVKQQGVSPATMELKENALLGTKRFSDYITVQQEFTSERWEIFVARMKKSVGKGVMRNTFARQLRQIPSCSVTKVTAIVNKYPTAQILWKSYHATPDVDRPSLLANLPTASGTCVGQALSALVHNFFCSDSYGNVEIEET